MSSSIGDILAYFKQKETPENIVPLIDNAELRNALVAWPSVAVRYKEPSVCTYEDDASRWNWMWHQVEFDQSAFGKVAGVKAQNVGEVLTRLQGLRLIYPDGTISNQARNYLQVIILEKLKKRGPGRPPKEKEPEEKSEN